MYKVIIIDDEIWTIEGLKKGVNWLSLGFEVIGHALNGRDGMLLFEATKPDVVITDVRMPDINGLELISQAKHLFPDTSFIVISGYAEFAYVQKAINIGAVAYILKPFDYKEIEETLSKVKKTFAENKGWNSSLQKVVSNGYKQTEIIDQWFETMNIEEKDSFIVISSIGSQPLYNDNNRKIIQAKTGTKEFVYLVRKKDFSIEALLDCNANKVESIGIGSEAWNAETLEKAMEDAKVAAYHFFIISKSTNRIFVYDDFSNSNDISDIINDLDEAIFFNNHARIYRIFEDIYESSSASKYTICSIFVFYNSFVIFFTQKYGGSLEDRIMYSYAQLVNTYGSLDVMLDYLSKLLDSQELHTTIDRDDEVAKQIVAYVNKNYSKPISAQAVAETFYMSVSQFCQIFKNETRQTFTQYISNLRIAKACRLLTDTNMQIQDVSNQVGFNDYFYFTKVFKKHIGKTPTEYRQFHNNRFANYR